MVSAAAVACIAALPAAASGAATLVTLWGSPGTGPGQFDFPSDLAISPFNGDVYVVDRDNHRIQQFTSDGVFIRQFSSFGSGAGQLSSPHGIDIDSAGKLYVADRGNHRVVKFSESGVHERTWGKGVATGPNGGFEFCTTACFAGVADVTPGAFTSPEGVTVDALDNVYVSEFFGDQRVQAFSTEGTLTGVSWGSFGSAPGQFFRPTALAAAAAGVIYVSDRDNHRIQKFDTAGNFLTTWGTPGESLVSSTTPTVLRSIWPKTSGWPTPQTSACSSSAPTGVFSTASVPSMRRLAPRAPPTFRPSAWTSTRVLATSM